MEKITRLIRMYYEAKHSGEKARAAKLYKMLWELGVIL